MTCRGSVPGRRRRLIAAGAAVAALTPAVPVAAAAAPAVYTVTASGSASVDVAFTRPVTLLQGRSRTITGTGSYAGYYLQPLAGRPDAGHGEFTVSSFSAPGFDRPLFPLGDTEAARTYHPVTPHNPRGTHRALPRGRYRLHVLGDRQTTVRLLISGAPRDRRLTAGRPSAFTGAVRDVAPPAAGQHPQAVAAEVPLTVRSAESLTFVGTYLVYRRGAPAGHWSLDHCLSPRDQPLRCHARGATGYDERWATQYGHSYVTLYPNEFNDAAHGVLAYYERGTPATGARAASHLVSTSAVIEKVVVTAFSLTY